MKSYFPDYTAYLNCGSALGQTLYYTDKIEDVASVGKAWQGMMMVTPTSNGTLGFGVFAGDNTRSIGIYEIATEEEIDDEAERGFLAINTFRHGGEDDANSTDPTQPSGAPGYVYAEVLAGRQYLLVGGSNKNLTMHQVTFVPEAVGYVMDEVTENTYAITKSYDELVNDFGWISTDEENEKCYGYYAAGDVLYNGDNLKIEVATDGTYTANNGNKMSEIKEYFPEYTAYINLGSSLSQNFTEDVVIEDVASIGKAWQGMVAVTPTVSGTLQFGVFVGDNTRTIGIYEVATEEEIDEESARGWVAINTFRHGGADDANSTDPTQPSGAPGYVSGSVTAGRQYLLIGGSNKNQNMHQITFVPNSTGIATATTVGAAANNKIYSIDGRYLGTQTATLAKGLYIMNGKKFIVK